MKKQNNKNVKGDSRPSENQASSPEKTPDTPTNSDGVSRRVHCLVRRLLRLFKRSWIAKSADEANQLIKEGFRLKRVDFNRRYDNFGGFKDLPNLYMTKKWWLFWFRTPK